jgi:signal transduction histidine kinase
VSVPAPSFSQHELTRRAVASVLHACDLVFGMTATAYAVHGTWLVASGRTHALTAAALWVYVAFNLAWSRIHRMHPMFGDSMRGMICLPLTMYLYVPAAPELPKFWIPALMLTIGIALTTGIQSRRSRPGILNTLAYAGGLPLASVLASALLDLDTVNTSVGMALAGIITALIARKLGRMLEEIRRQCAAAHEQKDRAEAALARLHSEIELRRRAESELRQAQKLESVGRLAAGVAHEINTPVQFVSDSLEFVRDSTAELLDAMTKLEVVERSVLDGAPSREAAELAAATTEAIDLPYIAANLPRALDRAHEGLSRVATIVRSMKEFAHPDGEDMQPADLNHAIESTLTIARNEYKDIAVLETSFGELPAVCCYLGELNQAVLNIVVNAAHAIGDVVAGTGSMGKIRIETRCEGDDAVIAIGDTGGGIPAAIQDHIFDPFFTTKPVGRGTGQGLAVAHSVIVDKHHGRISFETQPGKGTTFVLRVPIRASYEAMELAS